MASREPGHYWWTTAEKSVLAATLGIVIVFGICGNVLVIVAIVRFKRLRRSVNSYLILNLAIADFLTAFLLMPYHLATVLDLSIISGNGMLCKIGGILSYPFYICSTVTLVMLAIERHIAVSDPLRYLSRVTIRTILIMICFAWSQAIFFSLLFLILGNIEFSVVSLDCGVAWEGTPLWLSVVAVIMNIALPFILLLIMSLRVMVIARRHKIRIATQTSCVSRKQRKKSVFSGMEVKATVTILVVIFVFLILWIPFLITRGLPVFNQTEIQPIVTTSVVWLLHLNSVVNVVIYSLRRSDYRRAFVAVLHCRSLSRSNDWQHSRTVRTDNQNLTVLNSDAESVSDVNSPKTLAFTTPTLAWKNINDVGL